MRGKHRLRASQGLDGSLEPVYLHLMSRRPDLSIAPFVIREVQLRDLDALHTLSRHLNSVNFPHDRKTLNRQIRLARDSFTGRTEDPFRRTYLFVLELPKDNQVVGASMIYAQHGHLDAPHIFFDVFQDERYSTTLERHFMHTTLRLGFNYHGPTEIGALVLDPNHRSLGLGRPLSFVRFLFMAMYRPLFRDHVLAELMPPLTRDGRSMLWEHVGRRFTGLDYQEADKLSHTNKEFIIALFPQAIHATLLPTNVAAQIGQVGKDTQGVKQMLERIGFRYSNRIDPFDGGPHFEAPTDDITVVRHTARFGVSPRVVPAEDENTVLHHGGESDHGLYRALIGVGQQEPPFQFRATVGAVESSHDGLALSARLRELLDIRPDTFVWAVAL